MWPESSSLALEGSLTGEIREALIWLPLGFYSLCEARLITFTLSLHTTVLIAQALRM